VCLDRLRDGRNKREGYQPYHYAYYAYDRQQPGHSLSQGRDPEEWMDRAF